MPVTAPQLRSQLAALHWLEEALFRAHLRPSLAERMFIVIAGNTSMTAADRSRVPAVT